MDKRQDGAPIEKEEASQATRPGRRSRRRCAVPGCAGYARSGSAYCAAHRTAAGRRQGGQAASADEPRLTSHDSFHQRRDASDYRRLFGERMDALMAAAAEEEGIEDEIGVLRILLARLMVEEADPLKLAEAVARIAGVSVQAARVRHAISGKRTESFTDAVARVLEELHPD